MKHRVLAIIIALLTGAIVTLLLIPVNLSNTQLWVVFFITVAISFIVVWSFNEFIVFRDANKLNILIKKLEEGDFSAVEENFKTQQAQSLAMEMIKHYKEQNQQMETLIKKSDLRKQFIADVSHELKSPLFSAQGYVHTLLDGAIKDKEVRARFLKKAARNLDYIDILIQDLLTLSQIESEAIRMIPDHFDMIQLVQEVLEDRENKASKQAISLLLNYEKAPMIVFADYSRIMQVMNNLVNNGINYNKAGGTVTVELKEGDDGVRVSVIDDGAGIAEKYHERVFNRFFRIDKSRTLKKSTGLGLAIVKHILERHSTTIKLESTQGEGAKFSFTLSRDKWVGIET